MNMDMLSRGFDILQRAGGMEQISKLIKVEVCEGEVLVTRASDAREERSAFSGF